MLLRNHPKSQKVLKARNNIAQGYALRLTLGMKRCPLPKRKP